MHFEIIPPIEGIETFARGSGIRELRRVERAYGKGTWRKRKGFATVKLASGDILRAELQWYEASGIGRREFKIKRFVD